MPRGRTSTGWRAARVTLGVIAAGLAASVSHAAPPPPAEELVPGHVIVRYREPTARTAASSRTAGSFVARLERHLDERTDLLHAGDTPDAARALAATLAADPAVEWAEPEHYRRRHGGVTADDPLFPAQWSLPAAHVTDAWARSRGSPAVVVAILDTGILPHPDLVDRYVRGYDMISDPANAGDGDGRDPDPTDVGTIDEASSALHGIHVTGIIGAHSDNKIGIAGIDWRCRLLPVRVLGIEGGKGTDTDIADGIKWAAGIKVAGAPPNVTPASVINMSFGGPGGSHLLQDAVDRAVARGVIIVSSAGNDAADTATYAPAGLDHVIAVGASTSKGILAGYSNRGTRVDLLAPGGDLADGPMLGIISTMKLPKDGWSYVFYQGTSQAAPHVSGIAALLRAVDPTLGADRARHLLVATADPSKKCPEGCGGGLVNADAALAAVQASVTCTPACADGQLCSQNRCVSALGGPIEIRGGCAVAAVDDRSPAGGRDALVLLAAALGLGAARAAAARARRRRRV